MSLKGIKNVLLKSIATAMAITMVFGNISICGIGIGQAIAENLSAPDIEIELNHSKYVQYSEGENQGVAIQSSLTLYPKQEKDTYLVSKSVEAKISLPSLNGYFPERASVVEASTKATTGEEENTNIHQNYNQDSGLLTLTYENIPNYSTFEENAKDEFEIIYIYPAEAYTENNEEMLQYNVNAKIEFENATSQESKEITITEKENKKELTTLDVTALEEVYKGYLYSNVSNKTNYETEYKTISTYSVLNSQMLEETTLELAENEFILNNKENKASNGNIVYKATGISKYEFDRMLGQEGKIEIVKGEEVIATVQYIEVDNTKKLAVIYLNGNLHILEENETTAIIEYPEELTSLTIKISKPITEGMIHFENKSVIKASQKYGCEIEDIKAIRTTVAVNEYRNHADVALLEPETKMEVNSSNVNFSTLQTSKTTLTVKLDDTNSSAKLYNNPTITITLPKGLTSGNLSSPNIANGNGLAIKDTKAEENKITIELEGKQTAYDLNNVSGGASIVMDIENINYKDTLPTHTDKIEVACKQGKEVTTENYDVNIVSKAGLLMLSKLTGYDSKNSTSITMDSNIKTVEIESNAEAKEVVRTLSLVNNYDEDLTNVQIIGRIGYANDAVSSTFVPTLSKAVEVANAKVYYSDNVQADYDDDSWTEKFTENARAYKVVLNSNNNLAKASALEIKENIQLPKNIGENQEAYFNVETAYSYQETKTQSNLTVGMKTIASKSGQVITTAQGTEIPLQVEATPMITENIVHSGQLVTYKIKVTNNGTKDLENINIVYTLPENAIYTQYVNKTNQDGESYRELVEDPTIDKMGNAILRIKPSETMEFEIMFRMEDVEEQQEIKDKVTLRYNGQTMEKENTLTLKPAQISTTLTSNSDIVEGAVYRPGDTVSYYIQVTNTTKATLNNVKVEYTLPATLEYVKGGMLANSDVAVGQSNFSNNVFEYTIPTLASGEKATVYVDATVKRISNANSGTINTIAKVHLNDDVYETNVKNIEVKQADYKVSLNVDTHQKEILQEGDKVIYTIKVQNVGDIVEAAKIIDNIPEQLEILNVEYSKDEEESYSISSENPVDFTYAVYPEEELTIKITTQVKSIETESTTNLVIPNKATLIYGDLEINSNEVNITIKPSSVIEENPTNPNNPENPTNPNNPENPNNPDNPTNPEQKTYAISGIAWIDENKNGRRDENEKLQDSVIVSLINKDTSNFALDANGDRITTTTDANGAYTFNNLPQGTYIVLFEFDTNTYTVTTYQKEAVANAVNSDAMASTVTINGQSKLAAITEDILLDANKESIDIGFITNAVFDLSLEKQIAKVTVINSQGTEETEYDGTDTAKVDLVAKYMKTANVVVTYKFIVTNKGDVTGYVNSLKDNLPSGLEFNSEMNSNWYKGSDGKLYMAALSETAIAPGESIETELVLTKKMTEENTGTFPNSAELEKISNLENIAEKEEALENNQSSATLFISIKTGSAMMYIGITTVCIAMIAIGAYIIKKKVLNRGI